MTKWVRIVIFQALSGSVHEIEILSERITTTIKRLEKKIDENEYVDEFLFHEKFPNMWAVLDDKGYQRASEKLRIKARKGNN